MRTHSAVPPSLLSYPLADLSLSLALHPSVPLSCACDIFTLAGLNVNVTIALPTATAAESAEAVLTSSAIANAIASAGLPVRCTDECMRERDGCRGQGVVFKRCFAFWELESCGAVLCICCLTFSVLFQAATLLSAPAVTSSTGGMMSAATACPAQPLLHILATSAATYLLSQYLFAV